MRKIDKNLENPIDNILIDIAEYCSDFFKNTGHTPNIITTYSLLFGILSIYKLYNNELIPFALFFGISYFFDCLDGHMARKYNMASKFGDNYDHTSDVVKNILLFYIIKLKYNSVIPCNHIIVWLILLLLLLIHLGCQQNIFNNGKNTNENLNALISLCKSKNWIKSTRFFGAGTFNVLIIIYVFYLNRLMLKK